MLKANLLATKLHRPALPTTWVERPLLTQRLQEGLTLKRQLTLVSAPAGFGKTTCIIAWLEGVAGSAAWLSLDMADNDPGRFLAYLVAALQTVDPAIGHDLADLLQSGQLPSAEIIGTLLVNSLLAAKSSTVLVLDDFHLIQEPLILQVLGTLLANPLPALHLVLITREDPPLPLARLRANNQLTEIRARDLRFSRQDAARFLNETRHLSLAAADIAALEAKTEGWIVGLQLAALSLRDRSDAAEFIASLSGSHRFILDYLTEQVLNQQPETIQHFLRQTAILEKLNPALCDAVTGRGDGRSLLQQLFNANLFLIPLDEAQQWYRYHHLFADLLRERQYLLGEGETAVLHQRASHWFAQQNMVTEAMHHALAAADFATAVTLLEDHALELIMQGYVKTVNGWVEAIPAEWRSQSPKTNLAFAWMHLLRGTYSQAAPYLAQLQSRFATVPTASAEEKAIRAEWLVMKSLLLNMEGKSADALAQAEAALAIVPRQDGRVHSLAYFALATTYQGQDAYETAVAAYRQAIQHGQAAGNLIAEMLSVSGLGSMALERGQLHLAYEITAPVCERLTQSRMISPIGTVVYGLMGEIHYQWFQLEEAHHFSQRAMALSELGGYKSGIVGCRVLLSRLALLTGDVATAASTIQEAVALLAPEVPDYVQQEAVAQQVAVCLAQGQPAAAQLALHGQPVASATLPPDETISHSLGMLYNGRLRLLLNRARAGQPPAEWQHAVALADWLLAAAQRSHLAVVALDALLLRAQLRAALPDTRASQEDLLSALQLAEPEGMIGVFLEHGAAVATAVAYLYQQRQLQHLRPEFVTRLLAAFDRERAGATAPDLPEPPPLIEPLTERELELLPLMAEGLTYKAMADRLVVSVNTVRYHVKAIYGKLQANNRTQALETARQHHIL